MKIDTDALAIGAFIGLTAGRVAALRGNPHPIAFGGACASLVIADLMLPGLVSKTHMSKENKRIALAMGHVAIASIELVALKCLGLSYVYLNIGIALCARKALYAIVDRTAPLSKNKNNYKIIVDGAIGAATITTFVVLGTIGPLGAMLASTALAAYIIYKLPDNAKKTLADAFSFKSMTENQKRDFCNLQTNLAVNLAVSK